MNNIFNEEYYITVFSKKLYTYLKKKNVFPVEIEPNRKFPEYMVFKYKHDPYVEEVIKDYREGKLEI